MPGAFSCFFFGHAKKKKSWFCFDSGLPADLWANKEMNKLNK